MIFIRLTEWTIPCRSLTVNRLSGPIPSFLGNITTLRYMYVVTFTLSQQPHFLFWKMLLSLFRFAFTVILKKLNWIFRSLESNLFSGTVPHQLCQLVNLENLLVLLLLSLFIFGYSFLDYLYSFKIIAIYFGLIFPLVTSILNTNNLTGELPPALANLTKLTEL